MDETSTVLVIYRVLSDKIKRMLKNEIQQM